MKRESRTPTSLSFTVPLVPPSVNMYVRHSRKGAHVVTKEALAFKEAVAVLCRGRYATGREFAVALHITLGKGDRGDVDNYPKLCLDGLAACGAFQNFKGIRVSDAHIVFLAVDLDRKTRPDNGWTQITIEGAN